MIEIKFSPLMQQTDILDDERAIETLKNLIITNLAGKMVFTGNKNRVSKVMRLTMHTDFK